MIEIIDTRWVAWCENLPFILGCLLLLAIIAVPSIAPEKIQSKILSISRTKFVIGCALSSAILMFGITFVAGLLTINAADHYSSALHDHYGLIVSESNASLVKDVSTIEEGSSDEIVCTIEGDESDRKYGVYLLSNGDGTCSAYTKSEKGAYLPVTKVATEIEQVE